MPCRRTTGSYHETPLTWQALWWSALRMRRLMVFLGNPGKKYERTRHNAGRLFGAYLGERLGASWRSKFHGRLADERLGDHGLLLLIPDTMMNDCGRSARAACDFYGMSWEEVAAVYDETELPFGTVAIQSGGGTKGHNGVRSLKAHLGAEGFVRLRIGVGRPAAGALSGHVLGTFNSVEWQALPQVFDGALSLLEGALQTWPPVSEQRAL